MHNAICMTELKGTVTTTAACNNIFSRVPLKANENVPASSVVSGLTPAQSSDCLARFDSNGNSINPAPEAFFMFPIADGFAASHTTGGVIATNRDFYSPNDTYIYGYACPGCGIWVGNGTYHTCGMNPIQVTTFPRIELKPHKCPVCEGRGQVHFNPADPLSVSRDQTAWPCKPCTGSGVLWQ